MNRKKFIRHALIGGIVGSHIPSLLQAKYESEEIGYNHLPNIEIKSMNTVLHKADTRGKADHGWLKSRHTFSFANYRNPERMNFGVLRVLNDDTVIGGRGFGTHPHENMEIISIPLSGDLEHKDSMGTKAVIREGDIQVMSAGTGVSHSEYNKNADRDVEFLQIWVIPNKKGVTPRYDQISLREIEQPNKLYQILSPTPEDQGVWIHQDAWFSMGNYDRNKTDTYSFHSKNNGVYVFVIDGSIRIGEHSLDARDGLGIWDTTSFDIESLSASKVLVMEVPMS